MELNPQVPPKDSEASAPPDVVPASGDIFFFVRLMLRVVLGLSGCMFVSAAVHVLINSVTEGVLVAELSVVPSMIAAAIAVSGASFARHVILRIIAWAIAGLGAGLLFDATLLGGLSVGTWLTRSGIVLGIAGAALGILARRRIPPVERVA
jgi:uncharacterized membrane protein